ncbi:hypothetical protein QQS21_009265 [Conoideocrella luteorostrata]|uniref:Uncharacterized protein n=1 Tax=Conoideocrella luteorostrata TaxID=1105319 RepID=A0AAJ0CI80_9HYPO|nr:hypothetical protein QQS21_009265 [Conoideocrella luteorostrata]
MGSTTDPLILHMYDKLRETFGLGDNDLFQMEMPARLLEMGNYFYEGSDGINAQQVKPPAVAEAEFRLANGMLNLSNLVGGPNGSKLSESYDEVLFGLAPANVQTGVEMDKLVPDQQKIFDWLYEEVQNFDPPASDLLSIIPADTNLPTKPDVIKEKNQSEYTKNLRDPSKTPKIPRMDLYEKLLDVYQAERFRWVQFKNDARPKKDDPQEKWNAYDRLLTTYAPVIDAKLEALWAVLLVRGQYHRVRKYISYIDIQTAGEALQRAKESLRASATRSIDDTEDVYPVVFTPNNWAKYLSTNFRPEDMLADVENTLDRLRSAEKDRSMLTLRRDGLLAGRQDIKALEKAATDASNALRTAQTAMVKGYGETAINCIQMYFDATTKKSENKVAATKALNDTNKAELDESLKKSKEPPLTPEQWKALIDMQAKCLQNQTNVMIANDAYSDAQLAASKARGEDPSNSLEVINEKIQSLTIDIEYYQKMLQASENPMGVPITKITKVGADGKPETVSEPVEGAREPEKTPVAPPSQDGASVWQEFVMDSTNTQATSTKLSSSSVSHSDWSMGLWFASGSGHSDSATTDSSKRATNKNTDIQIGFRAMKVAIDRPWFNAQLLGQTREFFHFNANKISAGSPQTIHDSLKNGDHVDGSECMIPSWATAFVVVKDVHIILTSKDKFEDSEIHDMKSSSGSSGGFLCFQCSKSSSSSDHRDAFSMKSSDNRISIRIPAPQILGWVSQLAPEDHSVKTYTPFNEKEFEKPPVPVKAETVDLKATDGGINLHGLPTPPKTP